MISRRLIRIKVFQLLFSRIHSDSRALSAAETELLQSMEKTVDLYYWLLSLPLALKNYNIAKIESGLQKFHPTPEEAAPNRKFVSNQVIEALEQDKARAERVAHRGLYWTDHAAFVKKLFVEWQTRPYFIEYMALPEYSYTEDLLLLQRFFEEELEDREDLYDLLEDQNLYWADNLAYVLGLILRTLSSAKEDKPMLHPKALFKNEDDQEYALRLLDHALLHYDDYLLLIQQSAINWELERIAATDVALIVLGISEVLRFPTIPIKVSINEVVELSKYYSTPNSRLFVNGVLDKIVQQLKEEGKIVKEGRGLVE